MSFGLAQYRTARVQTASPVSLLVQLYDAALKHLGSAKEAIADGDHAAKGLAIGKAHRIVTELQATLDHEKAPEIAEQLDRLYDFVLHRIGVANFKNDANSIDEAALVMDTLRGAWVEIAQSGEQPQVKVVK
ncbi:MAG: flagellar export chaperone FliS [Myxococcota bacterium]